MDEPVAARPGIAYPATLQRIFVIIEEYIPVALISVISVLVVTEVIMRYVFGAPLGFVEDLSLLCFVWAVFLSAAGVARKRSHLRFDLIRNSLPQRLRGIVDLVVQLAAAAVLFGTAVLGVRYIPNIDQSLMMLNDLSWRWGAAALPAGLFLTSMHVLYDAYLQLFGQRDNATHDVPDPTSSAEVV